MEGYAEFTILLALGAADLRLIAFHYQPGRRQPALKKVPCLSDKNRGAAQYSANFIMVRKLRHKAHYRHAQ
jgi:hypothetical protein